MNITVANTNIVDSQEIADEAAFVVKVTYTNIKTPILTIDDAIRTHSIIPTPSLKPIVVGDPEGKTVKL